MKIKSLETYAVKLPIEPENLSFGKIDRVEYVITRVETARFTGYGEAATLQGPTWSEESQETVKSIIDGYITKIASGKDTLDFVKTSMTIDE